MNKTLLKTSSATLIILFTIAVGVAVVIQREVLFHRGSSTEAPSPRESDIKPGYHQETTKIIKPLKTIFVMEQDKEHLGGGFAISPDGRLLAYIGEDNGLYLHHLDTEQDQFLLKEAEAGIDVFMNPSFSPDGARVLFSASGGTWYYPSNIYSIGVDGSGLEQLTRAGGIPSEQKKEEGGPYYAEDFESPAFSPDGTKILLRVYDAVRKTDNIAIMDPDGSHLQILSQGIPLFWSHDGQVIYYSFQDSMKRLDLSSGESRVTFSIKGTIVGKILDKEVFMIRDDSHVNLVNLRGLPESTLTGFNIPVVKPPAHKLNKIPIFDNPDQLTLSTVQWSRSGRLLIVYGNEVMERIEVIE